MEYTDYAKYGNEPVDGFILQAPASDREALSLAMSKEHLEESISLASKMISDGREEDIMPRASIPPFFGPCTAYRWHSLTAPGYVVSTPRLGEKANERRLCSLTISLRGDDDYFSNDLSDAKLASFWGRFQKPVLIVPSGEDEYVDKGIDVKKNVERWTGFCAPGIASDLSDLIPGANHTVSQPESRQWLADTVIKFLRSLT